MGAAITPPSELIEMISGEVWTEQLVACYSSGHGVGFDAGRRQVMQQVYDILRARHRPVRFSNPAVWGCDECGPGDCSVLKDLSPLIKELEVEW